MIRFTEDQAAALVTDSGTLKRGRELASPTKWSKLGRTNAAAWGECAGSGSKPYLVGLDLTELAFKCSCPSRVFPCKHGAGLLLLSAQQPALLPTTTPPAWLAEWLAKRQTKEAEAEKAAQSAPAPATQATTVEPAAPNTAQQKREAQRYTRMQAGAEDLELWLLDLLRAGLADLARQPASLWERQAARLVDNQLPGLAATLRELAEYPTAGADWAPRLLGRLGELYVLLRTFLNREHLPAAAQQDVWQQVGLTTKKDNLLADPTSVIIADTWLVLGQYTWPEERVRGRRSWLYGRNSGRTALVLEFVFGNQPFATALVPQAHYAGELVFYPGTLLLRAAPINLVFSGNAAEVSPPSQSVSQLLDGYATALARQPWLRQWPAALGPVLPTPLPAGGWVLHHATEPLALPLRVADEALAWQWLALSGGQPLTLFGEWDGQAFHPLASWREDQKAVGNGRLEDGFKTAAAHQPVGMAVADAPAGPQATNEPPTPPAPALAATQVPSWPPLLRLALLGTRQSAEAVPTLPALPEPATREQQLLLSAGALALVHKAGYLPPAVPMAAPAPAAPDQWLALGALGHECLRQLLANPAYTDLLPDYLRRVAAAGRRVPPALLVPLLQQAARSAEIRPGLAPVLSERGRWLAALNPAWTSLFDPLAPTNADPTDLTIWETGALPARLAWLRQRFTQDAEATRALLLAALPTEPANVQEALLLVLSNYLHPSAEPTLEALLKSRSQQVRRQAATLLARLPGAALTERLWKRAAPLLAARPGRRGRGNATLVVTLPTAWDKTWLADGIEEKNGEFAYASQGQSSPTVGPATGRLGNLLTLLPPQRWVAHLGLPPSALLAAALTTEWALPLLASWAKSTLLHQDVAFAKAFLLLWIEQRPALQQAHCLPNASLPWLALAHLVSPADRLALLLQPLLRRVRHQEADWLADLNYVPAPWPRSLTEAVLDSLAGQLAGSAVLSEYNSQFYPLRQLAGQLTQAVTPNVALTDADWVGQRVGAIEQLHPALQPSLQEFVEMLRFRGKLTASLSEPACAT